MLPLSVHKSGQNKHNRFRNTVRTVSYLLSIYFPGVIRSGQGLYVGRYLYQTFSVARKLDNKKKAL